MHIETTTNTHSLPAIASTANVAERDKLDFWHDAVSRNLLDLEYKPAGGFSFDASLSGIQLNSLSLSKIRASAHSASRTEASIARQRCDAVVFDFIVSGQVVAEQDGRIADLSAGDVVFFDTARPYFFHSDQAFEIASLHVPRKALREEPSSFEGLSAVNLSKVARLCPLVFGYLSQLLVHAPMLSAIQDERVSQNFVGLLETMICDVVQPKQQSISTYRRTVLVRIKEFVERNLGRQDLNPTTIAAELKLKTRYINRLLESEGTSLSRYIWQRRLARSAANLRDRRLAGSSISSIALENGFSDLSHFSKAFRQRYDVSPRQYRQQGS